MLLVAIDPGLGAEHAAATVLVPAQDPAPPPGKGEEFGKASPIALVVILLLAVATALLIRGMTKRIKRLPASFDPPEEQSAEPSPPVSDAGNVTDRATGEAADGAVDRP